MKPAQALHAATLSAARLTGLDGEVGTLEPGKVADLVIADGDLLDIRDLASRIRVVYQADVLVSAREPGGRAVQKITPCRPLAGRFGPRCRLGTARVGLCAGLTG